MRPIDMILLLVALMLITLVVMQSSKDSAANAFSGEKSELFNNQKQRGYELILNRVTTVVGISFVVLSIVAIAI
ncbi:preprotein translocase subunit SecG [Candidatus Izimaplasma bacterium HR1]|jgi:preprotein translocase subunit SecG|uniref:preprotein translocase subunit SecG n=1 Tax=Candidatus Izimoplasma sp. HR1 TaxID=1541959 RepID=UPI0004F8546E|nr:preprotein translocase subunit SecG [Candidatus Izimaplasma bacterium HR1]